MTAEVAAWNSNAVALAADSASTLAATKKVYSTRKLFSLSKHHPVGVMIYGAGSFNGVPWETLIKEFRRELARDGEPTVEHYARRFLRWLSSSPATQAYQTDDNGLFTETVVGTCKGISEALADKDSSGALSEGDVLQTLTTLEARVKTFKECEGLSKAVVTRLTRRLTPVVDREAPKAFGVSATIAVKERLVSLIVEAFRRNASDCLKQRSGVVIAGFGQNEFFPQVATCHLYRSIDGEIFRSELSMLGGAGSTPSAGVVPFAQTDVAQALISGMSSDVGDFIRGLTDRTVGVLSGEVLRAVQFAIGVDGNSAVVDETLLGAEIQKLIAANVTEFQRELAIFQRQRHTEPLVNVIQGMPMEELAQLAEAVVNVTSVKRKLGVDTETVGGPIDVAIISKGDGFVWWQRHHYFDPKLNPTFASRYLD